MHNHFPVVARLLRIRRRRHDRLGRPPLRHRPVGPGHGQVGPGRDHPARRTEARPRREVHLRQRRRNDPRRAERRDVLRHRRRDLRRPRQARQQARRTSSRSRSATTRSISTSRPAAATAGIARTGSTAIRSRKQPNCPIEIGARTVAVCHLGNIAYLHGEELAASRSNGIRRSGNSSATTRPTSGATIPTRAAPATNCRRSSWSTGFSLPLEFS